MDNPNPITKIYFSFYTILILWLMSPEPTYCSASAAEKMIFLYNHHWNITINPATLELLVHPTSQPNNIIVSEGFSPRSVSLLSQTVENRVSWEWEDGQYLLQTELQESDLLLTIQSQLPGRLSILHQPASASGQGLILPMGEGNYIPKNHQLWEEYLLTHARELNTNHDLSLPLWGMDHRQYSLHWILTNPFNNKLTFQRIASQLSLKLSHEFTQLESNQPFTAILHLADNNRLAGAQHYRHWLQGQGRFEPLAKKLEQQPEGKKLLGATHLYLWGNGPLAVKDVHDWTAFITDLKAEKPFSLAISERLDDKTHALINGSKPSLQKHQHTVLIRAFNQALTDLVRSYWQESIVDLEKLCSSYQKVYQQLIHHFNRSLNPNSELWGGGLSVKTIQDLEAAGLTHLWLGVADGWEGGLWHPSAVAQAVKAGYLIAPYDSYETALQPGLNPDWSTAHMGADIHRNCGIVKADGNFQPGFQQEGVYTNPRCVRPFLQKRIHQIQSIAGFNSWFLDSYAAGLVFDDYRPGGAMTQSGMAKEKVYSMQWVSNNLTLVVGSEDGNAVTVGGFMFAHGMQTRPYGWGDADVHKNCKSPYFLGDWFPPEQPTKFFKPALVKEPYKTVRFDARFRLPLYQAVFHDSVITTHHWLLDNLKLANVQRENTLTQLLYNVPPLFHISRATLEERLPSIQRQDTFFRPLHQKLATQALIDFQWLNQEGTLQQTIFADGSWLIANFGGAEEHHGMLTLAAYSVTAKLSSGAVTSFIFIE